MVGHAFDDKEMTGYVLPEHSNLLLKHIRQHIQLLTRLAQPPIADQTQQAAPAVGMGEFQSCLDQLAEQVDLVLKAVSQPTRPASKTPPAEPKQAAAATTSAPELTYTFQADEDQLLYGVTLAQIDRLNLLIACITAYGDAVSADDMADFAAGTLSILGHTIFDRAREVDQVLTDIQDQPLPQGAPGRCSVEEPLAAYRVQRLPAPERHAHATPEMTYHALPSVPSMH